MTVNTAFEGKIIAHTQNHWDIVYARYESGSLYIEFQDGTKGFIPIERFPVLIQATEADFRDLEVSPCGLLLENENIEWDYAEAGLYKIISELPAYCSLASLRVSNEDI